MVTLLEQLEELRNLPKDMIGKLLKVFHPYENTVLLITALIIGYFLKKRYKVGNIEFVILAFMTFATFKFILG